MKRPLTTVNICHFIISSTLWWICDQLWPNMPLTDDLPTKNNDGCSNKPYAIYRFDKHPKKIWGGNNPVPKILEPSWATGRTRQSACRLWWHWCHCPTMTWTSHGCFVVTPTGMFRTYNWLILHIFMLLYTRKMIYIIIYMHVPALSGGCWTGPQSSWSKCTPGHFAYPPFSAPCSIDVMIFIDVHSC